MDVDPAELDLMTAKELADLLKMNPQVVLRKLNSGDIPGYKLGKDWRISRKQLLEWLERRSNQGKSQADRISMPFFRNDGRLKSIPAQRKKRVAVLEIILKEFELSKVYPEKEVNEIIRQFHSDVCTIRREFIMEKMMVRNEGKYMVNSSYLPRYSSQRW